MRNYRDLQVWSKAHHLTLELYRISRQFPREEIYGMTAQIRRAAVSVAANIAEGYGRETTRSFVQFPRVAQGSIKELETHLLLAGRVQVSKVDALAPLLGLCERVSKMLRNLIRSLEKGRNSAS